MKMYPDNYCARFDPYANGALEPSDGTIAAHDALADVDDAVFHLLQVMKRHFKAPGVQEVYDDLWGVLESHKFGDDALWEFADKYVKERGE